MKKARKTFLLRLDEQSDSALNYIREKASGPFSMATYNDVICASLRYMAKMVENIDRSGGCVSLSNMDFVERKF